MSMFLDDHGSRTFFFFIQGVTKLKEESKIIKLIKNMTNYKDIN